LAIAAGESPAESRASGRKSVSPSVRRRAAYSANSASRSSTFGSARLHTRSKRPGRIIAGSRFRTLLVAPMTTMPDVAEKPSSSTSSVLMMRLFSVSCGGARAGAPAEAVDLVDEHHARRLLARQVEELLHAPYADAQEHVAEVPARQRE
jgi:hypothetical protein